MLPCTNVELPDHVQQNVHWCVVRRSKHSVLLSTFQTPSDRAHGRYLNENVEITRCTIFHYDDKPIYVELTSVNKDTYNLCVNMIYDLGTRTCEELQLIPRRRHHLRYLQSQMSDDD